MNLNYSSSCLPSRLNWHHCQEYSPAERFHFSYAMLQTVVPKLLVSVVVAAAGLKLKLCYFQRHHPIHPSMKLALLKSGGDWKLLEGKELEDQNLSLDWIVPEDSWAELVH